MQENTDTDAQEWDFTANRPEGGTCINCRTQQNYGWHICPPLRRRQGNP